MTMTNEEEGLFLVQQVNGLRHDIETISNAARDLTAKKRVKETQLAEAETALADYMKGNGLLQTKEGPYSVTLGTSTSVEVEDIESVPERYIRVKTIKEVNKALIKAENLPESNWLKYRVSDKITITHEGA